MRLLAENVCIDRGGRRIVSQVAFSLESGALVVTGPNGSGKTTLLRALAGLLPAAQGRVELEGVAEPVAAIHYLGHRDGVKPQLTARENLAFAADYLGGGGLDPRAALDRMGVAIAADAPAAWLSAGQRRRVALARLLVARRPLWVLDEPLTALDVGSAALFEDLCREHMDAGGLIVAATHARLDFPARELRLGLVPQDDAALASNLPHPEELAKHASRRAREGAMPAAPSSETAHPGRACPTWTERPILGRPEIGAPLQDGGGEVTVPPSDLQVVSASTQGAMALLRRELVLAGRAAGGAMGVVFLLVLATLIPFAIGPDLNLLARIGPAILWVGALLATLLGLDRLFQSDSEDGALDLLRAGDLPLELVVLVKCLAHWLMAGVPTALAAPILGLLFAPEPAGLAGLCVSLLIGTPALALIGAVGAAVTVTLRRGGLLLSLIVLPLCVPVLIFGVAAADAARGGLVSFWTPLALLAAASLASIALAPFAAAAALRASGE